MALHQVNRHKWRHLIQSIILLGGMALVLMMIGWLIGGLTGVCFAAAGVVLLAGGQRLSPQRSHLEHLVAIGAVAHAGIRR